MVDGVFLNPNIHPASESEKRWEVLRSFARAEGFALRRAGGTHEEWLSSLPADRTKPGRCRQCYKTRLMPVARLAKEEGYDFFTTSLLLSVHQDHSGILDAGLAASSAFGVPFLYQDFRVGYKRSRQMARARGMYMQTYCGCEFSVDER